jgi:hypothetical protein
MPPRRSEAQGCDARVEPSRNRTPTHGYEPTREIAMAAFAKNWRREYF